MTVGQLLAQDGVPCTRRRASDERTRTARAEPDQKPESARNSRGWTLLVQRSYRSSNSSLASFRSTVSKPSVNQS